MPGFYTKREDGLVITLRVTPKASRTDAVGVVETPDGPALKIRVTAAPDKGKANAAVIALMAKTFSVAKSDVALLSGATDRRKVVHVSSIVSELATTADQWRCQ